MPAKIVEVDLKREILFEDNHLIALNKLPGDLVQGDETGDTPLSDKLKEYLRIKYDKPGRVYLGVIHRIDRPVSGVVLFAKTEKALVRMNQQFSNREVEKVYWALTREKPELLEGKLVHHLAKDHSKNVTIAYPTRKKFTKESVLSYRLAGSLANTNLLEVLPSTGRPHQIRAQLAAIGCPIIGDLKYGYGQGANPDASICLHARSLTFIHPVKKESITIIANPPRSVFWDFYSTWRKR